MEFTKTIEQYIEELNNELNTSIKTLETSQHTCQIVDIDEYTKNLTELEKTTKELTKTKSELQETTQKASELAKNLNEQNKKLVEKEKHITNRDNMLSQLRLEKQIDEYRTNKYKADICKMTLEYLNATFKKGIPYQPEVLKKYLDKITMVSRKEMKELLTQQTNNTVKEQH